MARYFKEFAEVAKAIRKKDRRVRWAYLEESLRLQIVDGFQHLMELMGLTQKELADRSETTQPMVSRLLSGEDSRSPTLETLVKLADALDARLDVRITHVMPTEETTWEERSTSSPAESVAWADDNVVVEDRVTHAAPAKRFWSYVSADQGLADAACEITAH